MLSFSDDELETIEMALRITLQMVAQPGDQCANIVTGFVKIRANRLLDRMRQYQEDQENGDA